MSDAGFVGSAEYWQLRWRGAKEIANTQAAKIRDLEAEVEALREKLDRLKEQREVDSLRGRITTICKRSGLV